MQLFIKIYNHFFKKMYPIKYAERIGVRLGSNCRLINVDFGSEPYLVKLGNHVSATKTQFITHDGGVWVFREEDPEIDVIQPIRIGNNVFFGYGSVVLPGITIGNNVVIGAGSLVTKDIPDRVVVAGVPAKVICTIDDYQKKCREKSLPTKLMTLKDKEIFLKNLFSDFLC